MNLLYITHYPKSCATKPFQCDKSITAFISIPGVAVAIIYLKCSRKSGYPFSIMQLLIPLLYSLK
ncbi:hypothetical protein [Wolbachia pipientis]|uniref:hypothetical protein n=1 Tax=Wolbachia pipientis TaxID=955 RepID=UPI0038B5232F